MSLVLAVQRRRAHQARVRVDGGSSHWSASSNSALSVEAEAPRLLVGIVRSQLDDRGAGGLVLGHRHLVAGQLELRGKAAASAPPGPAAPPPPRPGAGLAAAATATAMGKASPRPPPAPAPPGRCPAARRRAQSREQAGRAPGRQTGRRGQREPGRGGQLQAGNVVKAASAECSVAPPPPGAGKHSIAPGPGTASTARARSSAPRARRPRGRAPQPTVRACARRRRLSAAWRCGQPGGPCSGSGRPPGAQPGRPRRVRAAARPAGRRGSSPAVPAAPGACAPHPAHRSSRARGRKRAPPGTRSSQAAARSPSAGSGGRSQQQQRGQRGRRRRRHRPGARAGRPSTIHAPGAAPHPPGAPGRLPRARCRALGAARALPPRALEGTPGAGSRSPPQLPLQEHFAKVCEVGFKMAPPRVPEGVAHQPAVAADLGGSRWLLRGPDRAAWAGRARGGTRAALPDGTGRTARPRPQRPAAAWRCARPAPPAPALSPPLARPGPPPAPPRIVRPLGEPARRCAPEDRYGDAGAQRRRLRAGPLPAASPPGLPWGQGRRRPGRERRAEWRGAGGAGAGAVATQCGGGSTLRGLSATEAPTLPRQR